MISGETSPESSQMDNIGIIGYRNTIFDWISPKNQEKQQDFWGFWDWVGQFDESKPISTKILPEKLKN